jgi:hypothetical protein
MATVFRAPIDPPEISLDDLRSGEYQRIENEYIDELAALARENGKSPLLGETIKFPRGDGYARYMVWNTRPLQLVWLQLGDAWSVEDALIRGLRVSDVKQQVEAERRMAALFGGEAV